MADRHASMSDSNRGMFSQLPPEVFHQLCAQGMPNAFSGMTGISQESSLHPLHSQLRLEAALSGMDSSLLSNYIRSQNFTQPVRSMMDPFLAQARAAQAAGPTSMRNLHTSNMSSRANEELIGLLGAGSVNTPSGPRLTADQHERGPSSKGLPTGKKSTKKMRASKKLDIPYTDYNPGDVRDLSLPSDKGNLSPYQCLLRQQILLFAVQDSDIQCSAQGRNKPIKLGQVGVLCRHCANIPPGLRPCGAVYFPGKLSGLYQASQNMAINHFSKSCSSIPQETRERLQQLKEQKSGVLGGGKHFWANGARVVGVYESEECLLRFKSEPPTEDQGNVTNQDVRISEGQSKDDTVEQAGASPEEGNKRTE